MTLPTITSVQRYSVAALALLVLSLLEIACQTYWLKEGNRYFLSILYFLCGIGIAIIPLFKYNHIPSKESRYFWLSIGLFLLLMGMMCYRASISYAHTPLDYRMADMLPVIQVMNERWLLGAPIYEPIAAIWNGLQPNYLPGMWMSYLPAVALDVDLRWTHQVWLAGGLAAVLWLPFGRQRSLWSLGGFLPIAALLIFIGWVYPGLITITQESIVIGFYLLLGAVLFKPHPLLLGFSLAMCMLSRYALAFWLPMYLCYHFFFISRRTVWQTAVVMVVVALSLLTFSKSWTHLSDFLEVQSDYLHNLSNPAKNWGYANTIEKNLGLAKFVPFAQLTVLHQVLLYGSLILPWLCLGLFYRYRERLNAAFFPICSLKIALVFFFNTMPIPYSYLFYTSTFLSVGLVYAFLSNSPKLGFH